jgi:hypothetical protein
MVGVGVGVQVRVSVGLVVGVTVGVGVAVGMDVAVGMGVAVVGWGTAACTAGVSSTCCSLSDSRAYATPAAISTTSRPDMTEIQTQVLLCFGWGRDR